MSKINSLSAEIDVIVPGTKNEITKKARIEVTDRDGEVTIAFRLGAEARKQLIDVIVNSPEGVKAHIVEYKEGIDLGE